MKNTKLIIALATLGVVGTGIASLANAQSVSGTVSSTIGTTQNTRPQLTDAQKAIMDQARKLMESGDKTGADALLTANGIQIPTGRMHGHGGPGMDNMKKVDDAIIAGDYTTFKTVASTSPFAAIDEKTFNQLTPQFKAKKAAEDQIQTILSNAGIKFGGAKNSPQSTTTTTTN